MALLVEELIDQHHAEPELLVVRVAVQRRVGLHLDPNVLCSAWIGIPVMIFVMHGAPSLLRFPSMSHPCIMTAGRLAFHPAKDLNPLAQHG